MLGESRLNAGRAVFVFGYSVLNTVVEAHYQDSPSKNLLKLIVLCKQNGMQQNFVVTSNVMKQLYVIHREREGIVSCIKGMLHEEGTSPDLSVKDSTIKLAQLKQLEGLDVFVVTQDDTEMQLAKESNISFLNPDQAQVKINEIHSKLGK